MRNLKLLFIAALIAAFVPSLATVCFAQANAPCDILASATPCVAAFSTTRALIKAYTGNLYQVIRQSDSTATNIVVLTDCSGYAASATQDAFCINTTCTITKIYDQTSNHNDLTLAPPGAARQAGLVQAAMMSLPRQLLYRWLPADIRCMVCWSHPEWVTAMTRPAVLRSMGRRKACIW